MKTYVCILRSKAGDCFGTHVPINATRILCLAMTQLGLVSCTTRLTVLCYAFTLWLFLYVKK